MSVLQRALPVAGFEEASCSMLWAAYGEGHVRNQGKPPADSQQKIEALMVTVWSFPSWTSDETPAMVNTWTAALQMIHFSLKSFLILWHGVSMGTHSVLTNAQAQIVGELMPVEPLLNTSQWRIWIHTSALFP